MNRIRTTATAQRRRKQIEDCLYDNLLHTPYRSISVADICRQVGISRKAYYNYYPDKDSCFAAVVDRFIRDSMLNVATLTPDDANPLTATCILLDHWKGRRDFLDIIMRNDLLQILFLRYMAYIQNEEPSVLELLNNPDVASDTDILACYTMSQMTLVLQWYFRGFDTPTEEIAKKYLRVIHAPMISLETGSSATTQ